MFKRKYSYSSNYSYKKNNILLKILLFLGIICIILLLLFVIIYSANNKKKRVNIHNTKKELYKSLYQQKNYLELIKQMDIELQNSPFHKNFLMYRGYSYFFLGDNEKDINKQKTYFISSLIDLRKVLAIGIDLQNEKNLFFTIGKIYFLFGEPYYRQSLKYFNYAKNAGLERIDLYYNLGILYSYLGQYNKSCDVFLEAVKIKKSDMLLLALGHAYYNNEEYENAKFFLNEADSITDKAIIKDKANFIIGEVLFKEQKLNEALVYLDKALQYNENNADAYFLKGEVYYSSQNYIKARSLWRKALEIDPSHIKALKRIYNN